MAQQAYDPRKSRGFHGIRDASRGYQNTSLRPGRVVARIDGCEMFEKPGGGEELWKTTLTILAVDEGDHRVGEVVSTFIPLKSGQQGIEMFQRNLKSFVCSVLDEPAENVGDEDCFECLPAPAGSGALNGNVVVITTTIRDRKDGAIDPKTQKVKQYPIHAYSKFLQPDEIIKAIGAEGVQRFFPNGLTPQK